jgi:hypothetical protein
MTFHKGYVSGGTREIGVKSSLEQSENKIEKDLSEPR